MATKEEQVVIDTARLVRDFWFFGKTHDVGQDFSVHALLRFALRDLGDFDPNCMSAEEILQYMARYGTPRQNKKEENVIEPI